MKKLIIAAVIVCTAVLANAAAIDWNASQVFDAVQTAAQGKNVAASGWLGYVVMEADYATVTADLAAGKTTSLVNKAVGPVKKTSSTGKFSDSTATGNIPAGEQSFYLIVLNSGNLAEATAYASSGKTTTTVDASLDTSIAFGSMKNYTSSVSNWTTVAAPEPTSGLLLLLGVAGLALKRKRA